MRIALIGAVVAGGVLAQGVFAQTAPAQTGRAMSTRPAATMAATAPASAPKHVADYSDPRKTVVSFLTADNESDLREALIIGPDRANDIETLVKVMGAQMRLQKAAVKQYGAEGEKEFGIDAGLLEDRLRLVAKAVIDMQGDGNSAIIHLPGDEAQHETPADFVAKKVEGLWKLDAITVFSFPKAADADNPQVKVARALLTVTEQAIKDIEVKKYGSAREAREAFWKASIDAVKVATSGPSTAPGAATKP